MKRLRFTANALVCGDSRGHHVKLIDPHISPMRLQNEMNGQRVLVEISEIEEVACGGEWEGKPAPHVTITGLDGVRERVMGYIDEMYANSQAMFNSICDDIIEQAKRIPPELKPCPFCGGEAEVRDNIVTFAVLCVNTSCGSMVGWFGKRGLAVSTWNSRE